MTPPLSPQARKLIGSLDEAPLYAEYLKSDYPANEWSFESWLYDNEPEGGWEPEEKNSPFSARENGTLQARDGSVVG